jgi:hypothetical protein
MFVVGSVQGQFTHLKEGKYKAFNGTEHEVYILEGKFAVSLLTKGLLVNSQLSDTATLFKMRDEIDGYYQGYKELFGIEPVGGNPNYQNKTNVFFGPPSCGAACGLLGTKGVEIGGNFLVNIYNEIKFQTNVHPMVIVGYEFGRNFFTQGNKLLFPSDPKKNETNGGFAEAFANLGYLESYLKNVYPTFSEKRKQFQETNMYHNNLIKLFHAYINDTSKNPFNSLQLGTIVQDYNRNPWHLNIPSFMASGILVGTYNLFNKPDLKNFLSTASLRENATSSEYAMGTIALGLSKAINLDLNNYFMNVLKFKYDDKAKAEISILPKIQQDKLIRDLNELYFITPFDSLRLNIRSINYSLANIGTKYVIKKNEEIVSSSIHGNNILNYGIFGNQDQVTLKVLLIQNDKEIDSYEIILKKRRKIESDVFLKSAWLYSRNGYGMVTNNNSQMFIENISNLTGALSVDSNILKYSYPIIPERKIKISGQVKFKSFIKDAGYAKINIAGRFGSIGTEDIGIGTGKMDTSKFYDISFTFKWADFFKPSEETKLYDYMDLSMELVSLNGNAVFRNFSVEDLTDTDNDGFLDFSDNCPKTFGTDKGCPLVSSNEYLDIQNAVKIYPNPVGNSINISFSSDEIRSSIGSIQIVDISGRVLFQGEKAFIQQGEMIINTSEYPNGTYFLQLKNDNKSHMFKFIILK